MLLNCKPGCSGKKTTTTALLDVDTNQVVCDFCGANLEVSSFVKNSMKQRGEIVKKDKRKSFQFDCQTCNKIVKTKVENNKLVGQNCSGDCKFNVSSYTIHAMESVKFGDEDASDE